MGELAKEIYAIPTEEIKVELIGEGDFKDEKATTQPVKKRRDIASIYKLLRERLSLGPGDGLHVYVGDAFIPSPKESLHDLHQKFKNKEGILVIKFTKTELYG